MSNPKKQVAKLIMLKQQFVTRQKQVIEKDLADHNQRFNVLVEPMSQVLKEHMHKSREQ